MERCPFCGSYLIEVNDKLICPNCGIIEDKEESKEQANYIG